MRNPHEPVTRVTRRQILESGALIVAASASGALAACARQTVLPAPAAGDEWLDAGTLARRIALPSIPNSDFVVPGGPDARAAIQDTIDRASDAGGGRVIVPRGLWRSDGPLRLRSRVEMHLGEGAHLRFSGNAASYLPVVLTRWEGTEVWTYSPMVFADGLEDVAITGPGTIDGQGEQNFLPWRARQKPDQAALRQMGNDGVPVDQRIFGDGHWLRPHFVQFRNCRRVLIDGPRFVDSPFWVNHLLYCSDATVRNIEVVSRHINSDGVDVDSSTRVLIENCRFDVGDDGVAIKSGRDQDGWRVDRPSTNVIIRNCEYLGNTGGAMAIGSEMSGGVSDVFVENYRMNKARHALYFKANLDRGGKIDRVFIRDIDVAEADSLLIFTNDYHSYRGGDFPARFENVSVEDVRCGHARVGLSIIGHERAPVRNVTLRNVAVATAEVPLQVRHVDNLQFENVTINGVRQDAPDKTAPASFAEQLEK